MEPDPMADIVIVEAVAPWASWRPPEALTYHRTLPLPPYTTLVGMMGAAVGLDLAAAYRFIADRQVRLGVGGWCEGQAHDLWKFQKLKDKEVQLDILLREVWIDAHMVLLFETSDSSTARSLADGFQAPAFPLAAGTSDALLKSVAVRVEAAEPISTRSLAHVLVFREILPNYELHGSLDRDSPSSHDPGPDRGASSHRLHFRAGRGRRLSGAESSRLLVTRSTCMRVTSRSSATRSFPNRPS